MTENQQTHPGFHRVAIVEDHTLQRERTEEVLQAVGDLRIVARCEHLPQFVAWLKRAPTTDHPDLLVLDLSVERGPGADPATVATLTRAGMKVLVLSAMASPAQVREVLKSGVAGFVGKRDSASSLVEAVTTVLDGGSWMTAEMAAVVVSDPSRPQLSLQEERALVLYASGLTLEAVAEEMGVGNQTAKTYLTRVKSKYAAVGRPARSKLDLSRVAAADGFVDRTP